MNEETISTLTGYPERKTMGAGIDYDNRDYGFK